MSLQKRKGFSLIELLIVVAIILIIAAIAIPNLMRARIAANESSAAGQLRTLNTAEGPLRHFLSVSYVTSYPSTGYGTMANLGGLAPRTPATNNACLIDNSLATNCGEQRQERLQVRHRNHQRRPVRCHRSSDHGRQHGRQQLLLARRRRGPQGPGRCG
jgi:prepilin-type N-terminal cleavage/methylation domain-containing protein